MAFLYLWHCLNTCIFWSNSALRSGFSVNAEENDFGTRCEDERAEFKLDFFPSALKACSSCETAVGKSTTDLPSSDSFLMPVDREQFAWWHLTISIITRIWVKLMSHLNWALCHPACATSVTVAPCLSHHVCTTFNCMLVGQCGGERVSGCGRLGQLLAALWNCRHVAKATSLQWQLLSYSSQIKTGCFDWSLLFRFQFPGGIFSPSF